MYTLKVTLAAASEASGFPHLMSEPGSDLLMSQGRMQGTERARPGLQRHLTWHPLLRHVGFLQTPSPAAAFSQLTEALRESHSGQVALTLRNNYAEC